MPADRHHRNLTLRLQEAPRVTCSPPQKTRTALLPKRDTEYSASIPPPRSRAETQSTCIDHPSEHLYWALQVESVSLNHCCLRPHTHESYCRRWYTQKSSEEVIGRLWPWAMRFSQAINVALDVAFYQSTNTWLKKH